MIYDIKRGSAVVASIVPDGKQSKKIMDINVVDLTVSLSYYIEFAIGDYITVYGEKYTLQDLPDVEKESSIKFNYTFRFKGRAYQLVKIAFLGFDSANQLTEGDFSIMGTAETIIDQLVLNANRADSGWVKGTIDQTAAQNFSFSNENCLSVLSTLADTYNIEWWVDGQTIHMTKRGSVEALNFKYGQGNGLYSITRTTQTDKNICTRLYVYGSDQNIPGDYRNYSKRLKLPGNQVYLESNVAKYGIIEHIEIFDDVKPEYIGTITSVSDIYNFIDVGIDFDINAQRIAGVNPKVTFLTGQLAGYNFEIPTGGYDAATKKVTILKNADEKAIELPSALLHPSPGDTYSYIDMNMPQTYITAAENRVLAKGQAYLNDNDEQHVLYGVVADPLNLEQRNINITLGNYVGMVDTDFALNSNIRIVAFTRDVQRPFDYTFDLQDVVNVPKIVREYNAIQDIKTAVSINKLGDIARARMNYKTSRELLSMIFDPDGNYFNTDNIKAGSIETLMLAVGAKSQQLVLNGILFSPNLTGDASKFSYTSGQLVNFTIADTPVTWTITGASYFGLAAGTAYYVYGKCLKAGGMGQIILSTDKIVFDQDATYYHFLIGVLHSVIDGVRGISLTYGQTTINGKFITTGVIYSTDGNTYFNLDTGEIGGKIKFLPGSTGYNNLADKPDLSVYATGSALATVAANAANALSTANRAAGVTDYLFTTIDGNLIATGTLLVGDASHNNGGLTGVTDAGENSIRFFLGSDFAHRADAPLRFTQAGKAVMTDADITGTITASSGKIGNWSIDTFGLSQIGSNDAYVIQRKVFDDGNVAEARIGTNILAPSTGLRAVGYFENSETNSLGTNYGIIVKAANANNNVAADLTGNVLIHGGLNLDASTQGFWVTNIMDEFNTSSSHSGQVRGHVTDSKCFLVIHNG
jgi:hypothetical protein